MRQLGWGMRVDLAFLVQSLMVARLASRSRGAEVTLLLTWFSQTRTAASAKPGAIIQQRHTAALKIRASVRTRACVTDSSVSGALFGATLSPLESSTLVLDIAPGHYPNPVAPSQR